MKHRRILLVSGIAMALFVNGAQMANDRSRSIISGVIVDGKIFSTIEDPDNRGAFVSISRPISGSSASSKDETTYLVPAIISPPYPLRWRITFGCFWTMTATGPLFGDTLRSFRLLRIPFPDLDRYWDRGKRPMAGQRGPTMTLGEAVAKEMRSMPVTDFGSISPLSEGIFDSPTDKAVPKVHFDFLPTSESSCSVFVLFKSLMTVWNYTGKPTGQKFPAYSGEWVKQESFPVSFAEPFEGFSIGSFYAFVTDTGSIFLSKKDEHGRRNSKLLWKPKDGAGVDAIVNASDSRVFIFGDEEYFELREDIAPVPYTLQNSGSKNSRSPNPLERSLAYCQILRSAGVIGAK